MSAPYSVEQFDPVRHDPQEIAMMHLGIRCWQEATGQNAFSNIVEAVDDISNLEPYYIGSGGNFFVASEHDQVIGLVALRGGEDREGSVKRLAVLPEQQGRGIGRALVGTLVEWADGNDFQKLTLCTNKGERARAIYEHFGFVVVDFLPDKGKYGDWVMERTA